jgi:hypothetical protein
MLLKLNVTFVSCITGLMLTGVPSLGQIAGGTLNPPPPGDRSQRIAAAKAEFPSLLEQALSPEGIQAMLARVKEMPIGDTVGLTDFDNVSAPCGFADTSALRGPEQYAEFQAPSDNWGGILNGCSNFGIAPLSPPNFLAFNNESSYGAGGVPRLPELIGIGRQRTGVSLYVSGGDGSGYLITVVALGPAGMVGVVKTTTTPEWVQVSLTGTGIDAIALIGNPYWLVVDNIQSE